MDQIKIGAKVPIFSLPATGDEDISIDGFIGKNVIVYFYPKDSTPGCTTESQGFRDLQDDFTAKNTVILGISRDSIKSHNNFKNKHSLPFDLLSDADEVACKIFNVIKMKNMYGKQHLGIERSTFLIDSKGVLRQEWRKVRVKGHIEAVLEAVRALD